MIGVKFNDKHSYDDLGLYLKKRIIYPPEVQTNYVEVPQRDGKIDLSEGLTGLVKYYNRKIEFQFVLQDESNNYQTKFSEVENYLHGKKMKIIFDDDFDNYYIGRLTVEKVDTNETLGEINVTAECEPYKYDITSSDELWLWDPFDFEDGVINEFIDVVVNGTETITLLAKRQVTYPTISVDSPMKVEFDGVDYDLSVGENKMYDILLPEGANNLTFKGNGTVTIRYRGGSL